MSRALTAEGAELHLFQTLRHRLFVTGRGVVPALAFAARQNREITHFLVLSSSLLFSQPLRDSDPARSPGPTTSGRDCGQASHRRLAVIT